MVLVMRPDASEAEVGYVVAFVKERYGLGADVTRGEYQTVIGLIGDEYSVDFDMLETLKGVERAHRFLDAVQAGQQILLP